MSNPSLAVANSSNPTSSTHANAPSSLEFSFPSRYNFPPMWTLQPTLSTRSDQMRWWSSFIQSYCAAHRLFRLSLHSALDTPLFYNTRLNKRLSRADAQIVLDHMASEEGGKRAEWIGREGEKASLWVYWRRPEEWAESIENWAEETGQKNTVLTLYELTDGETSLGQDFHGMDRDLLQKALQVLVKRGRAQVFGSEDEQGVKIF